MPADPRFSAGARLERRSIVLRLRRRIATLGRKAGAVTAAIWALNNELAWMLNRQKRYDKRKGGLGK